jgi:hypothetical protein
VGCQGRGRAWPRHRAAHAAVAAHFEAASIAEVTQRLHFEEIVLGGGVLIGVERR